MTIIHYHSNRSQDLWAGARRKNPLMGNRQALIVLQSSSRRYRPTMRSCFKSYFNRMADQWGHAKTVFLSGILIALVVCSWLVIFSANITLDYQISTLKKETRAKEDSINLLHEEVASIIADNKIQEWAQANGFVEVKIMHYVDLNEGNLVQANNDNQF